MATIGKKMKWQWQKFVRALAWPKRALREFKRLYRTMGAKGVFWYMAIQGRWHFGLTLVLCLLSLPLLYVTLLGVTKGQGVWFSWLAVFPVVMIVGFLHYVLFRRTGSMVNRRWMYMTRLYVAPVLVLVAVMALAALLQVVLGALKAVL